MDEQVESNNTLSVNLLRRLCTSMHAAASKAVPLCMAHCLSAREPTMVPKIMDEPKPAMKSRPMSLTSKP